MLILWQIGALSSFNDLLNVISSKEENNEARNSATTDSNDELPTIQEKEEKHLNK